MDLASLVHLALTSPQGGHSCPLCLDSVRTVDHRTTNCILLLCSDCAVNRDKQVKSAFFGAHLSDIDVGVADRVSLERLLASCLAFDRRKPADLVALEQSMQRRSREMRDGRLEGIKAIVSGNIVCLRNATASASSSALSTVERGTFGPIGAS